MPNRRWTTAWRLLKTGQFKEITKRTSRFLISFRNNKTETNYLEWRKKWVELNENEKQKIKDRIQVFPQHPTFSLLLKIEDYDTPQIFEAIQSVKQQLYPHWILWIANNAQLDHETLLKITDLQDNRIKLITDYPSELNDWVIEITPKTILHEAALFASASSIIHSPEIRILYTDHDHIDPAGNFIDPHMKPDWNPDLFAAMNYFAPFVICEKELWEIYRSEKTDLHDFLLEATKNLSLPEIFHIPDVLASIKVTGDGKHLEPSYKKVLHLLPEPEPFVSILIPTRDNGKMLEKCLNSVFKNTDYENFELILVDHETTEKKAIKVIDRFSSRNDLEIINFTGSFNFSSMMNRASETAKGDVLILLNNDTEVIEPDWMNELVSQVSRRNVGIVGALLLFSDGTIQHAGIHPGLSGLMGHGHKHLPGDSPGYFNRLKTVHGVAAVTGACLAIKKSTWVEIGGMDEDLAVAYNDVDLCLEVRKKGLRVLLTPFAKLLHHESISRGMDSSPEENQRLADEIEIMREKWGEFVYSDPAYNPNLSSDGGGFRLHHNPFNSLKSNL